MDDAGHAGAMAMPSVEVHAANRVTRATAGRPGLPRKTLNPLSLGIPLRLKD